MATIQWYPGHMAKARRQVTEALTKVDIIYEIVDARVPESSRNPLLDEIGQGKKRLLVLNKADLANPAATQGFIEYYQAQGLPAVAIDAQHTKGIQRIIAETHTVLADYIDRQKTKGVRNVLLRAMCVGVPNVGKSTILNRLAGRNIAQTGNTPGVTRAQQWIKTGEDISLLDTPGILWPKFEDPLVGKKLALTGGIKDTLFHADDVALFALETLVAQVPDEVKHLYRVTDADLQQDLPDLLMTMTARLGFKDDYDRTSWVIINDVRKGKLGRFTWDAVPQHA
ncbi:ribosome biogenesis GTPase YlqF [Schleiferilactobacillus harbinensis]|nr:ribosome biogenesis GTPase YlqF [Schleiferilactobacillus harbinensis]HAY53594.1 ribosome biogenesis GTPase YlqF [Lactobacillus sp.]MBO3090813.1 ribosome biogenesis GTPase YlqF [Schleiferilactobacillus harbinensis]MCT2908294.1 ribosome biogenesis GTPase YlqF [Schleiferilactobacillus harbinensis]QFR23426.1 ribosome biogenesis GTPase YlqF [Schleiferilactobacillus harbinensis]QFR64842.1 ribosome biogenesis GTPase YlqF [Schleiferilactobacillus harbinensis]